MNVLILFLLSPAVMCTHRYRKSANPNDEPFLPIHPDYPYSPKLMKRGIEHAQTQQPQTLAQLSPELYAPKVDARDTYSTSYGSTPYLSSLESYSRTTPAQNSLTSSPYYQSSLSSYNANPYSLLSPYTSPYGSSPSIPGYGTSPYGAPGSYPYYYYQPPYYYPNYYNQPPYPPPPPGYPGKSSKHHHDDEDDDEDDGRRQKSKKPSSHKNKVRNSDRDVSSNQYVDGTNYIISNAKDLDGESSSHRVPSQYNQIEDSDVRPRTVAIPKTTYRLVSISGQQPTSDYNSNAPSGYIKIQQLEQLMRQALARLLAQNAAQQASLAQIQQEAQQQQQQQQQQTIKELPYITVPNSIAKTGLSYVVNPTILTRVNPGQFSPSALIQTPVAGSSNKQSYPQKTSTSVTSYQSPGIYIPPGKASGDQQPPLEYGDYDAPESATARTQPNLGSYQPTAEPSRSNYPYSTYRPTQQTSLEDVNFGSKQKSKSS